MLLVCLWDTERWGLCEQSTFFAKIER